MNVKQVKIAEFGVKYKNNVMYLSTDIKLPKELIVFRELYINEPIGKAYNFNVKNNCLYCDMEFNGELCCTFKSGNISLSKDVNATIASKLELLNLSVVGL